MTVDARRCRLVDRVVRPGGSARSGPYGIEPGVWLADRTVPEKARNTEREPAGITYGQRVRDRFAAEHVERATESHSEVDAEGRNRVLANLLGPHAFSSLVDRYAAIAGSGSAGYFTPASPAALMSALATAEGRVSGLLYDPYARGGELLAAAIGDCDPDADVRVRGVGQAVQSLRIAAMRTVIAGRTGDFRQGDSAPWHGGDSGNFAWLQHAVASLAPDGVAVVLMPAQAAVSADRSEVEIRRRMVAAGVVRAVVALPARIFPNTDIAASVWIVARGAGDFEAVLLVKHLRDFRGDITSAEAVDERAAARLGKYLLEPNDILLARSGSMIPPTIVGANQPRMLLGNNLVRIRIQGDVAVDRLYLLAYLSSPRILAEIAARATGTAVSTLSKDALGCQTIIVPPLKEQRWIGTAMDAVDDQVVAFRALAEAAAQARAVLADGLSAGVVGLSGPSARPDCADR